jgi:hypothetical protein
MPALSPQIHPGKKYLYSFLSLLCVVGWIVLLVSVLYISENDRWMTNLPTAHALTVAEGIVGGSILILMRVISTKRLKYSFIYNLCGTLNIMVGSIGLLYASYRNERPSYLIAGSFAIGLYIYHDIYFRKTI